MGAPQRQRQSGERYSHSQACLGGLASRYGISPKTVVKWRGWASVSDLRTKPWELRSTALSIEDEAVAVAFCCHTLLPLDDCLYALQPSIPYLTCSSLHRCLPRHGTSCLPDTEGDKPGGSKFERYLIGYFHIDTAVPYTIHAVLTNNGTHFTEPKTMAGRPRTSGN